MNVDSMGARIKQALRQAGVTQRELAVYCGVSERAVGSWVADDDQPRASHLTSIAELLGVTPAYLVTGEQAIDAETLVKEVRALRGAQEEILAAVLEIRRLVAGL